MKRKPLNEQVMVITGASSGIGLATAQQAAKAGAKVVLAARNGQVLEKIVQDIQQAGGEATFVVADVSRREDVEKIAQHATEQYGGFDTWVNNAGVGLWGKIEDIPEEDARRLLDADFWGMVHGSLVALPTLKERGGALINLGSVESDVAFPLQAFYGASKHAIKAFTRSLRMELMHDRAPVSVTLIKPSAIASPFFQKARYYTGLQPWASPPHYSPKEVAHAILTTATRPHAEIHVGMAASALATFGMLAPGVTEWMFAKWVIYSELRRNPGQPRAGNLFETASEGVVEAEQHPVRTSYYTRLRLVPGAKLGMILILGVLLGMVVGRKR
ncbi:SDR family oxidoreductase [Deinococcus cellulosilyticus]|uniref:Glucose a-dehydrogenase YxnA n=1 Tax=Deinococcus cellulosilyticus (strain DSM 18568 / NBRC 106333 / KACC 11606 / 5516J-15) TaxID=1223518 RepID=A0A511MWS7_DEIC1|nr:SDR family oxidoreductase [Deinococcus cellulosilyticus]GEM44627.1 glucose a-dehydrogenase YxnA [Deinococcus cellulosilyticus NBRC 106333 = KACC 11606]